MPRPHSLLSMLALALLLAGCGKKTAGREEMPPQTVTAAVAARHDVAGALTASGRLLPREEMAVAADLSGFRVSRVLVEEGQRVRAGEVLAVLDDSLLRSQIDQVRATLAQQQVAAEQAVAQAGRVEGLDNQGVLSKEAIETRRFAARTGRAAVAASRAQLNDLLTRQAHLQIRAPAGGVILERTVRPGDTSAAGTAMFRMARDSEIELYAELPESDIGTVAIGDPAEVVLASGRKLAGHVRLIGMRVDPQTGATIARIALPNDPELRQGGFAEARFTRNFSLLAVPEAAVHFDADGASVTLIDGNDRVRNVKVRTGRRAQGLVEIVSGLAEGSRVAVKGSAFVLNGDKVKVAK
ncbi:efflux RND transporter periplasmic adaptor subunit [Novosphingobium sp. G106]|uniref:efflux RND transporter periplasmic adaptor subunit n=1 Tax=Novosphingobium sp. G106 TaxID=2849500 RepID=UPI001C2D076C|nr:efflux RND transporter periplasmic adaptor subunit [Novosphingobium sp. G106]MBV1688600.1 efflux RND transporter periplasmic adaptor subunit [Novosphingobium sp. G106]